MMKKSSFSSAYIMLLTAIFVSSFVNVVSKIAAQYDFLSIPFLFFYGIAMLITVGYSVVWQLTLEKISLISAYMARGLLFVFIYLWSVLIFKESLNGIQILGGIVILTGVVVSQYGKV